MHNVNVGSNNLGTLFFVLQLKGACLLLKTHVEIEGGWPEWFHVCGECHGILSSSRDKEVCPYCKSELDWSDMYVNLDWSRQNKESQTKHR